MKKLIAITGGIGCGKTTACEHLKKCGYPVLSADGIYSQLLEDEEFVLSISNLFSIEPIRVDDKITLDRKALSDKVFNSQDGVAKLNAFTHPAIMDEMMRQAKQFEWTVICEVPLLYEGGFRHLFDGVVIITRNDDERFLSASIRDGVSVDDIKKRASKQFDYSNLKDNECALILQNRGDKMTFCDKVLEAVHLLNNL